MSTYMTGHKKYVDAFGRFEKYVEPKAPLMPRAPKVAVLAAHVADALDDRYLWEYMGDKVERDSKLATYNHMQQRRDIIALTEDATRELSNV